VMEGEISTIYLEDVQGDPTRGMVKSRLGALIVAETRGEEDSAFLTGKKYLTLERGPTTNPYTVVTDKASADAIIGGEAFMGPVNRNHYTESRKVEVTRNNKRVKETHTFYCEEIEASLSMTLHATRTADGSRLGQFDTKTSYSHTECEDGKRPMTDSDDAIAIELSSKAVKDLVDGFVPHYEVFGVKLKKDKTVKDANKCALQGEFDLAMAKYLVAFEADEYNTIAIYNIAALHEVYGNFDQAIRFYEMAEGIAHSEDYVEAIQRVEARKQQVAKLTLMGMEVTPHNFEKVAANSCCVKGDPKKRCSIVAEPDKNATLVKKVPGGMRLELLDEEGKWFRVKLRDGTEGWIQKKDLLMN